MDRSRDPKDRRTLPKFRKVPIGRYSNFWLVEASGFRGYLFRGRRLWH